MSDAQIGKLFLLAMSTSSDAEALSALEMMRTALKRKGVDTYVIAEALNSVLSGFRLDDRLATTSVKVEEEKDIQATEWQAAILTAALDSADAYSSEWNRGLRDAAGIAAPNRDSRKRPA